MKILVVEDEIKLAEAIKRALELHKYVVDVVYDGEKGLDLVIGEKYDLIILDSMLPKMDGIEICKEIRKAGIGTPLLMLTARGQIDDKVNGLDAGADDYMVKPFSFEELFARIRALVRRPEKTNDTLLKIKDLSLDPISFQVKRSDKTIYLSTREFSLLEYLMKNKNKILSKEQIVNNVWSYDADILFSTVEVHIKHLRDKIEAPFPDKDPVIKTVHGFGYTIEEN
ncbi:response regulator transcription factor [Candidatus Roizmanbacteria bacterium]|nr:response regulator transcription factor [Candidatus Roizmanbacteria bacterium]